MVHGSQLLSAMSHQLSAMGKGGMPRPFTCWKEKIQDSEHDAFTRKGILGEVLEGGKLKWRGLLG